MSTNKPTGWLLTIALITILILPMLLCRGMFFDGLNYATISRNLAEGKGTFWKPFVNETIMPLYYDHPPLVFGIQSWFFRLLGDHYWTEKVYCLFIFLISLLLIVSIWRIGAKRYAWLPIVFWMTIEIVKWCYVNDFDENTMGVFCLLSSLFFLKTLTSGKNGMLMPVAAGICMVAAMLCKSPVGLFPLAIPFLYWLTIRTVSLATAVKLSAISLITVILIFALLWQWPDAQANLSGFLHIQLFPSMAGKKEDMWIGRFYIIFLLLIQLLPALVICGLLRFFVPRTSRKNIPGDWFWFYLFIGLSASLPIMASLKQQAFYLLPSVPFFALAAGTFAEPYIDPIEKRIGNLKLFSALNIFLILFIIGTVGYSLTRIGKIGRDETVIHELDEISNQLPVNHVVSIPYGMFTNWTLQAYLYRFYHVSVAVDAPGQEREYYLTDKANGTQLPAGYVSIVRPEADLQLYKKR